MGCLSSIHEAQGLIPSNKVCVCARVPVCLWLTETSPRSRRIITPPLSSIKALFSTQRGRFHSTTLQEYLSNKLTSPVYSSSFEDPRFVYLPLTAGYGMINHSPRGGCHKVIGRSEVEIGADFLLHHEHHHLGVVVLKGFKALL